MKPIATSLSNFFQGDLIRDLASFFVPKKILQVDKINIFPKLKVVAIIPTHKPSYLTLKLIKNLSEWYKNVEVVIVDDSNQEQTGRQVVMFQKISKFSRARERVHYTKTLENLYKAGALNNGFNYVKKFIKKSKVIITFDDDVIITKKTVPTLVNRLCSSPKIGAVCSRVRIRNKDKNIVTRLQGLEYHSFNITKISDNGFFKGPLVMQGMLTAFKTSVFDDVGGFSVENLIEDYEITANLKKKGWNVVFSSECWAWTDVPEKISSLRKQRIRWTYWGLEVVKSYYKYPVSVLQDLIGHSILLLIFGLVGLSFIFISPVPIHRTLVGLVIILSLIHFSVSYVFSIFVLRYYKDADWKDYLIRLTIFPEFIYSNFLTLILVGSYFFFGYNKIIGKFEKLNYFYNGGLSLFNKVGYSFSWGTRVEGGERNG